MKNTEYGYTSKTERHCLHDLEKWHCELHKHEQVVAQHKRESRIVTRVWRKNDAVKK